MSPLPEWAKWLRIADQRPGVTWRDLLMFAGVPGAKPDRMVVRFVVDALVLLRPRVTSDFASEAVTAAAEVLSISPADLDHGILARQRRQL